MPYYVVKYIKSVCGFDKDILDEKFLAAKNPKVIPPKRGMLAPQIYAWPPFKAHHFRSYAQAIKALAETMDFVNSIPWQPWLEVIVEYHVEKVPDTKPKKPA